MKNLIFINAHPPRVGGGCFLAVMRAIQKESTIYDGMIYQSKNELLTEKEVKKYLEINPTKFFISSHRITLEVPMKTKNIKLIAFVRNPINKIRSHYLWSRKVEADDEFPEARQMTFLNFVKKFVHNSSKSKVETLLSSFMVNQINFLYPNYKNQRAVMEKMIRENKLLLFPVEEFDHVCVLLEKMYPKFFTDMSFSLDSNWTTLRKLVDNNILKSENSLTYLKNDYELWSRSLSFLKEKIKTYFENEKEFNNLLVKFRRRCLKKKIGRIQGHIINKICLFLTDLTIKLFKFF